jgi:peptidoglycan/xylan/chitin deacetylase (PgdA/CDA1 family)
MLATGSSKKGLEETNATLVLCYHSIPERGDWLYDVTLDDFEKQLDLLRNDFHIVKASEVLDRRAKDEKRGVRVALTFDDGYEDNFTNVFPAIAERGIPATFFLTLGYLGINRNRVVQVSPGIQKRMMRWEQLREMAKVSLVDFGSHGLVHRDMSKLTCQVALGDMTKSRKTIEEKLGRTVSLFSYPGGFFSSATNVLLPKAGYTIAFNSVAKVTRLDTPPFEIGRVAIAKRNSNLASFVYLLARVVTAGRKR